jgi:hypothetical protein
MTRSLLVLSLLGAFLVAAPASAGKAQKKANAKATKQVRDSKLTGTRPDTGEAVTLSLCANGTWASRVDNGISTGKRWKIAGAAFTKKGFTAVVKAEGGFEVSVGRRKGQWLVGITRGGEPDSLHPVQRTRATAMDCTTP